MWQDETESNERGKQMQLAPQSEIEIQPDLQQVTTTPEIERLQLYLPGTPPALTQIKSRRFFKGFPDTN